MSRWLVETNPGVLTAHETTIDINKAENIEQTLIHPFFLRDFLTWGRGFTEWIISKPRLVQSSDAGLTAASIADARALQSGCSELSLVFMFLSTQISLAFSSLPRSMAKAAPLRSA